MRKLATTTYRIRLVKLMLPCFFRNMMRFVISVDSMQFLTYLDLGANLMSAEDVFGASRAIIHMTNLQHLDLSRFREAKGNCKLHPRAIHTSLTYLDIARLYMMDEEITKSLSGLHHCTKLQHLNLCKNHAGTSRRSSCT